MLRVLASNPKWEKLSLFFVDILLLLFAAYSTQFIRFGSFNLSFPFGLPILVYILSVVVLFYIFDLYHINNHIFGLRAPGRAILACSIALLFISLFSFSTNSKSPFNPLMGRGVIAISLLLFAAMSSTARALIVKLILHTRTQYTWVFLHSEESQRAENDLKKELKDHINLRSILISNTDEQHNYLDELKDKRVVGIVISDSLKTTKSLDKKLMSLRFSGIRIYTFSQFYQRVLFKIPVDILKDNWFTMSGGFDLIHNTVSLRMKRIIDIILAVTLSIFSAPIMLISALIIRATSRGPAIYSQTRIGERGAAFTIYKLRSMQIDAERNGARWAAQNDTRITRFGRFIRATRIDELPQLLNVLKGEMSFIGPRPERPEFIDQIKEEVPFFTLRNLVKPGLTGWAQVYYPYGASIEDAKKKVRVRPLLYKKLLIALRFCDPS